MNSAIFNLLSKTNLPIVSQLGDICDSLNKNKNLVLQAEPGAGKTTLVPLALLDIIANPLKIIILEPRRLAARNAAIRMSDLLGESVGQTVGYRIRNDTRVSHKTRIEVITEGILTRMLQSDPELPGIGLIIFDEFHERSLDADLGLAFSIEVQQNLRDDLKLLVMSATIDTAQVAKLLDDAPIINSPGRCFPVEIKYLATAQTSARSRPNQSYFDWSNPLLEAVKEILKLNSPKTHQDILIFLPGIAEISHADEKLQEYFKQIEKVKIFRLYGNLPFAEQQQVLKPIANQRKIILSTNIAETSVTIDGVGFVIDSGLMRQSYFDPNVGFNRLKTQRISSASAIQRSGRAGRLAPGKCYRLWSESENLRSSTQAEILRQDLASFVLELAIWGIAQPSELKLLDQPNQGMLLQAQFLLRSLSAIDQYNKITPHGHQLSKLSVHPRIAHMLVRSVKLGVSELACLIAAMLEEKDLLPAQERNNPDYSSRINYLLDPKNNSHTKKQIVNQAQKLQKKLKGLAKNNSLTVNNKTAANSKDMANILLALIFPDRIAQQRGTGYRLANGSGAISNESFFIADEFLVVVRLGGKNTTAKIFQAIGISRQEIESYFSDVIVEKEVVNWQEKSQAIKAERQRKLGEIILDSKPIINPNQQLVLKGLLQAVLKKGISQLTWSKELRQWQSRVNRLHQLPSFAKEFPDITDQMLNSSLEEWLAPYLTGFTKLSQITVDVVTQALKSQLDWPLQQKLDELMPLSIKVASGSQITLDYSQTGNPVLAVKLQEMFGQKQTPKIAAGQLSIVVHLLSPARRPLQITDDLESFWKNGYSQVKKEMRGKYPKHPWPDDPVKAVATKFTKKKMDLK